MLQGFYTGHVGDAMVGPPTHSSFPVAFVVLWLCVFSLFRQGNRSRVYTEVAAVDFYLSTTAFSFGMASHTSSSLHQHREGQP